MTFDEDEIQKQVRLRQDLYALGAVDLDPRPGTIGFEQRKQSVDRRQSASRAWGSAPYERDIPRDLPGRRGGPGR